MNQNVICWFETYVKDIERAKKFYSTVLEITFHDIAMPVDDGSKMAFFSSPQESGDAVSGALVEMLGTKEGDGKALNSMVYFPCHDCSIEESRVVPAGGKIHQSKMSLGDFGYCAICVDSEDNYFGLFSMQ